MMVSKKETARGVAASIESMAGMRDGTLKDALMRLQVIEADAKRIQRLLAPKPPVSQSQKES